MHSGYKAFIYYAEFPQEFHLMMSHCSAVLCICCASSMTSKTSGWHAAHSDGLSILSTSFIPVDLYGPLWTSLDPCETSLSNCLHRCLFALEPQNVRRMKKPQMSLNTNVLHFCITWHSCKQLLLLLLSPPCCGRIICIIQQQQHAAMPAQPLSYIIIKRLTERFSSGCLINKADEQQKEEVERTHLTWPTN